MRTVFIFLICLALLVIVLLSARDEARHQQQRHDHRQYYLHLLKKERIRRDQRCHDILHTLSLTAETPGWEHALDVAKTYHRGWYPDFRPNTRMAASIYQAIISKCDDVTYKTEAQGLLYQCTHTPLLEDDIAGNPLPLEPGNTVLARIHAMIYVPPVVSRTKPPSPPHVRTDIEKLVDAQNSHDHGVTASMKSILHQLRDEGVDMNTNAKEDIEALLFSETLDMSDEEKAKTLAMLESLNDDHTHSTLGVTETEALGLVWSKLGPTHAEIICKQLASGIERGAPVCSTGKIARIVSALDGVTPNTRITPMWAVREELGTLAAQVRSDVLGKVSVLRQAAYERGEAMDLEDQMSAEFTQRAMTTYCEELGMEKAIVQPLVDSFAAGF